MRSFIKETVWFAWYPVKTEYNGWVWWCYVYKKMDMNDNAPYYFYDKVQSMWIHVNERLPGPGRYKVKVFNGGLPCTETEEEQDLTLFETSAGMMPYWTGCFDWRYVTHWYEERDINNDK